MESTPAAQGAQAGDEVSRVAEDIAKKIATLAKDNANVNDEVAQLVAQLQAAGIARDAKQNGRGAWEHYQSLGLEFRVNPETGEVEAEQRYSHTTAQRGYADGRKQVYRRGLAPLDAVKTTIRKIANGADEATAKGLRPDLKRYGGTDDVTFVWGDEKKGLFHIGFRRGADVVANVVKAVVNGEVTRYDANKKTVTVALDGYEAILSLDRHGDVYTWLLTGWKTGTPDATGEVSTHSGATHADPTFSRADMGASVDRILNELAEESKRDENIYHQRTNSFGGVTRGSITFDEGRNLITLFKHAKPTTLLHETGHMFLEMMKRTALAGRGDESFKQDWAAVLDWLGITDVDFENINKTGSLPIKQATRILHDRTLWKRAHEEFASAFEVYLAEGKAPTSGLAHAFERFKAWLLDVYKAIQNIRYHDPLGAPKEVKINDRIRRVFDHLLAEEEARQDGDGDQRGGGVPEAGSTDSGRGDRAGTGDGVSRGDNQGNTEPLAGIGHSRVRTASGMEVDTRFKLVDVNDLITSNTSTGAVNPAYPQELQPRNRDRLASTAQIEGIISKLDPTLLGDSRMASDGAPIVGADGVVESGNGRAMALREVYRRGTATEEQRKAYKKYIYENAEKFGINKADVTRVSNPVLVRERVSDVDRQAFTRAANEANVAAMSSSEQAQQDASYMTSEMLRLFDPTKDIAANYDFVRKFIEKCVSTADRNVLVDKDGRLSQDGVRRIKNALFARAYGDPEVLQRMAESVDSSIKSVNNGLLQGAARFALMEEYIASGQRDGKLSLKEDLSAAVNKLSALVEAGENVEMFLNQGRMFSTGKDLTPEQIDILRFLYDNRRSGAKIAKFLDVYADQVAKQPDPTQNTMFGKLESESKSTLLNTAMDAARAQKEGQGKLQFLFAGAGKGYNRRRGEGVDKAQDSKAQHDGQVGNTQPVVRPGKYNNLSDLVSAALSDKAKDIAEKMLHHFGAIGRQVADGIKRITGIDVSGRVLAIKGSGVRHIANHHGVFVAQDDFAKIPEVIEKGTPKVGKYKGKNGEPRIEFEARIGNSNYTLITEVTHGGDPKHLIAISMWKKEAAAQPYTSENGHANTKSRMDNAAASNGSVSQPGADVKTKTQWVEDDFQRGLTEEQSAENGRLELRTKKKKTAQGTLDITPTPEQAREQKEKDKRKERARKRREKKKQKRAEAKAKREQKRREQAARERAEARRFEYDIPAPTSDSETATLAKIWKMVNDIVPLRKGQTMKDTLGHYDTFHETVRTKLRHDVTAAMHELGHFLDMKLGITKDSLTHEIEAEFDRAVDRAFPQGTYLPSGVNVEGLAQFLLSYMTNDAQNQTEFPATREAFFRALRTDPDLKQKVREIQRAVHGYMGQDTSQRLRGNILNDIAKHPRTVRQHLSDLGHKVYTMLFDRLHELNRLNDIIMENAPGAAVKVGKDKFLPDYLNIYAHARTIEGAKKAFEKRFVDPFFEELKTLNETELQDLNEYLAASRAQDYRDNDLEPGLGTTDAGEQALIAKADPKVKEMAKRLQEIYHAQVKASLVQSGIMSEATFDMLRTKWPNYVPFLRVDTEGNLWPPVLCSVV
jgi:hypothetical protein